MATRALKAIRINESLALRSELTRVMSSMVVAGRRNLMFFSAKKAVDERWEVVMRRLPNQFCTSLACVCSFFVQVALTHFPG
jgi:hypothetical protein